MPSENRSIHRAISRLAQGVATTAKAQHIGFQECISFVFSYRTLTISDDLPWRDPHKLSFYFLETFQAVGQQDFVHLLMIDSRSFRQKGMEEGAGRGGS